MNANDINDKLRIAVYMQDVKEVKVLLSARANPNLLAFGLNEEGSGNTLLHSTANIQIVKELLLYNANVNAKNNNGETPILTAINRNKNIEIIRELLENGAEINRGDIGSQLVLHRALSCSAELEIIRELLKYGAIVNVVDNSTSKTPLYLALEGGGPIQTIKELIRYGAEDHQQRFHTAFSLAIKLNIRLAKSIIKIISIKNFDDHEQIIQLDTYSGFTVYDRLKNFHNECVLEIIKMKSVILDQNDLSLYEFVRNNFIECNKSKINELIPLSNKFCIKLSNINFSIEYPIFNDFILDELKYFLGRADSLRKLDKLRIYTEKNDSNVNNENNNQVVLDLLSKLKIAEYLSNNDLLSFIKAFNESNED